MSRLESFLRGLLALSQMFERLVVDVVSAFTPWLAPLMPAYLVYSNLTQRLGVPDWVAIAVAVAVECLGLSSINTALALWRYNDERRQSDHVAPFGVALLAGAFYIAIVVTVNALVEVSEVGFTVRTLAYALLSLLSVDAGLIIAIRAQHARRLADIAHGKVEARERRQERREARDSDATLTRHDATPLTRDAFLSLWRDNGYESIASLARRNGVNPRRAQRWVEKAGNDDV